MLKPHILLSILWLLLMIVWFHLIIYGNDVSLRAEFPIILLVFAFYDGEGIEDVDHGIAGGGEVSEQLGCGLLAPLLFAAEVEMEKSGVELAAELKAALFVPLEGRAVVAAVAGEGGEVMGGVDELEDAGEEPVADGGAAGRACSGPGAGEGIGVWGEDRNLLSDKKVQMRSADFKTRSEVTCKTG